MNNLHAMPVQGQGTRWTQKELTERVKTLTMQFHSVKVAQMLNQILDSEPLARTVPSLETPTTR